MAFYLVFHDFSMPNTCGNAVAAGDLMATAMQLLAPKGRIFLSLQDRPGEATRLEALLDSLPLRRKRLERLARLDEEVAVVIFELSRSDAPERRRAKGAVLG